jgi:transcriptional regulator with XRE-family HTH domain
MNTTTPGQRLKSARKLTGRTQGSVATATGLTQSRISQLELGKRYPTEEEWARLQEEFPRAFLGPLPQRKLPAPSEDWRARAPRRPLPSGPPFSSRLHNARKTHGVLVDKILSAVRARENGDLALQVLEQAGLDSGLEVLFWLFLLLAGAKPCCWAIAHAGFQAHRVAYPETGINITHSLGPCLEMEFPHFKALLFPQVSIDVRKAYYRLDALVCIKTAKERIWLDVEIDGRGHDATYDAERQARLQLPVLRLTTEDVTSPNLLENLERRLASLFQAELAA